MPDARPPSWMPNRRFTPPIRLLEPTLHVCSCMLVYYPLAYLVLLPCIYSRQRLLPRNEEASDTLSYLAAQLSFPLPGEWHAAAMCIMCGWYVARMRLACSSYGAGMRLVCDYYTIDRYVNQMRLACGCHVIK